MSCFKKDKAGFAFKELKMRDLTMKPDVAVELEYCVRRKIEQTLGVAANKSLGAGLFAGNKLELAPFKPVSFSGWGNWEQDPLKNRSWQWRLNWLPFLSYLMAHHQATAEDAVLEMGKSAIVSWLDSYLKTDTSYPFEFIWHDHATALRAEQFLLFSYYCQTHAPTWAAQQGEFLEYLVHGLEVHGKWLAKDSFYSEHTNHGLEQARVLLLLGTVFEGPLAREWQKTALRRLSSELSFAFTDEGVHVENSPAYHVFVFKVFIGILKDYPADVLGDLGARFEAFSSKALGFITHILRPDGTLPPIGDTEQLPTSDSYRQMFGHTQAYQHFLYAHSQGKQGQRPDGVNRVYPKSGYAIFRDQWPDSLRYDTAFHLVAKVGCSSRYHHQGDEGHISLYAEGEDWLIDSGLYNYINDDPVRKYMRGRGGHNVPIISGATYPQKFDQRLNAWRVLDFSDADVNPFLSMELNVLESVRHVRRLEFFTLSKRLVVVDKFDFSDGQLHDVTLQWHIPCDKDLEIEVGRVLIKSKSGKSCSLTFSVMQPDGISVAKGRKGDKVFSCLSVKANEVVDTQVIRVLFKNRSDFEVVSVFDFKGGAVVGDKDGDSVVFDVVADCSSYKVVLPDFKTDYIQKFVSERREPYEFPMLRAMALGLGAKDLILDVGANIGNHTLFFSCVLGARVWAFEPNLRLSHPLEKSVELNSVGHLVRVFPVGVGAEPGRAVLDRIDENNLGAQSLDLSDGEGGDIEVIRLDDLDFDSPVSAIKIDVEGMELAVLHGAERLICRDRPLLVIESSDVLHFDALESFIKNNGYVYCSSFNGTPTHFFIHQERLLGSPWLGLYFDKGREFYRMRSFHKKLNKAVQLLRKLGHNI